MIYVFISLMSFCVYILECPLMEFEFPDPATVASRLTSYNEEHKKCNCKEEKLNIWHFNLQVAAP